VENEGSELSGEMGGSLPDLKMGLVGDGEEPERDECEKVSLTKGRKLSKGSLSSLSIRGENDGFDGSLEVDVVKRGSSSE